MNFENRIPKGARKRRRKLRMHGRKSNKLDECSAGAEDKFCFTLLPCASSTCIRAYTCKRVYGMVSQRRNRRGSFQATPVRMRRGRPLLSPAFLVAVYRSHRGRGFERRRRPPRRIHFRARCYRGEVSACVGGTIHIHVHKSARGEKRRNGRHCSLSTCARETTDDGTILHFARYPPSGASVEQ